jgi:carbamoyl-phosphate synthase large subunit
VAYNVLISSASAKVPLIRAAQRALESVEPGALVIAGDLNARALSGFIADDFWEMPRTTAENTDALISGCLKRGISLVLPTRDGELDYWANARADFAKAGIAVAISAPETITFCRDKLEFSRHGISRGLPVIPSFDSLDDVPSDRVVVKERFGAGSRGILIDAPKSKAVQHASVLDEPIFQPFIAGTEISVDCWSSRNGDESRAALRIREIVIDGESKVTRVFRDAGLELTFQQFTRTLGLEGPSVVQALMVDGEIHIIECNPRFGGASTAGISAGLNTLELTFLDTWDLNYSTVLASVDVIPLTQVRVSEDLLFP